MKPVPSLRSHRITLWLSALLLLLNFGFVGILFMLSRLGAGGGGNGTLALGVTWEFTFWFILASGLAFSVLVFVGIIRPLHHISTSLREGSPDSLEHLLKEPTEMGDIARRLQEAFQQRDFLEQEIAVRQQAEAQVRQREGQLQDMMQDRERLLHDLHDGLIQSLYGIGLKLENARAGIFAERPQELSVFMSETTGEINALLTDLRGSLQGSARFLREVRSLSGALSALVGRFDGQGPGHYHIECAAELDSYVTPGQALEIHAICSEALMNVMRHAKAREVHVALSKTPRGLQLEVRDDGVGFIAGAGSGLGLASMRQRAQRLGANVDWQSTPGRGTCFRFELPLPPPTDASIPT